MSSKDNDQSTLRFTYKGLGLAIGMIVGGIVGLLIDNPIIFTGGGMVLGFAIGSALDSRS